MAQLDFSDLVRLYAPWSLSKADTAKQCSKRFHLKYVLKTKEPSTERSEGRVGAAAHKALELLLKGEDHKRAFKVAAVDNKLTTNEIDSLLTFQGTLKQFLHRIDKFKKSNPIEQTFIEHQFAFTVDLQKTSYFGKDVFFRGVWDLGLHLNKGDLLIIDHKSGQKSDTMDRYTNQLNSYAIAGRVLLPTVNGVQSAINYLQDGTISWGTYVTSKEIDERLIDWFVSYLNSCVENLSDQKATPGWYCGFCGYASSCDAYQDSKR